MASRGRVPGARTLRWLVALVALVVALALLTGAALGGKRSSGSFGPFAGYLWQGRVHSMQASWTVPRILGGSSGVASMWIGAVAPGTPSPFVQIGTLEGSLPGRPTTYVAFWSDIAHDTEPQKLFHVHPGDNMSASLALAGARWRLSIVDRTSGATARFATSEEAGAGFNLAEWLQEDVTTGTIGKLYAYPRLTPVGFRKLAVNSSTPAYGDLYSQWLSANGKNLAPTPLDHDSFTLRPATVSSAGAKFLHIVAREQAAGVKFDGQVSQWNARTSRSQIVSESSTYGTALRSNIQAFSRARWPTGARALVHSLISRLRALLTHVHNPPFPSSALLASWKSVWTHEVASASRSAHMLRRTLNVPDNAP